MEDLAFRDRMRSRIRHIKSNRTLLTQLIFTILAFVATAILSYMFVSATVHNGLVRNANSVLDLTEDRISANLLEFESTIDGFADITRGMILQGADKDTLQSYIEEISSYSFLDGKQMSGIQNFFGYFQTVSDEPVLLYSRHVRLPEAYHPQEQNWYLRAVREEGRTVETIPFINESNETLYTYSKCIFDETGQWLGIVGLNVQIDLLGQSIVDTALNQGGYGILINQDGSVLFHPNEDFRSVNMYNPDIPLSEFAGELNEKGEILEQPMRSYKGENAVAFFRTLRNGWHLGLVTPEEQYYQGIANMGFILGILAVFFAAILIVILIRLDAARAKSDTENRQKSMFLANMSHEIRTPINAIVGMTAIGKTVGTAARKDYCFTKIDDASRHLLGVINDILDISKIEANKIDLSPVNFNFEKMLQQVINVSNFRIEEKEQQFRVYIDKAIPRMLYADDQRLAQVITNLLSNAVKFTPEKGSILLTTRLLSEENDMCTIQIEVADNGIGISPEQQSRLFQSFQQAESSTSRKYGGTGLGLSISKHIVELMGGKIQVESDLGKGAVFSFTVKVKRGDDTKYGLANHGVNWGNVRILVVDDDQDILDYFKEIIKGFGADCTTAGNAEEALSLVEKEGSFDIYFVDLKMPDTDGIALTKKLRAKEEMPGNAIVIMISSADLRTVEDDAKNAGVDKFLLKPIFPSAIADIINECIGSAEEIEESIPDNLNGIFNGRHILFAEDVEVNREIFLTLLEPTALAVTCAENGVIAIDLFLQDPDKYDLIIMDVQMPEMDGLEATRQIRAYDLQKAKDIPIIAMTANVFKEDVEKCLAAGMNAHLGKPLDMDDLIGILIRYLGKNTP